MLATFGYDDLGRRTSLTRGNGTVTSYGYDAVSRLQSLAHDLAGSAGDLTVSYSYNPAGQIVSQTRSNDAYAWTGHGSGTTSSTANGLNQLSSVGGAATAHDARGNLTLNPTTSRTYAYDSENKLISSTSGGATATLYYDPLGNLTGIDGPTQRRFVNDGIHVAAEVDTAGNIVRRQVRGDGPDEILVEYNTSDLRYYYADERGSTISASDPAGNLTSIDTYDEFGRPSNSSNPPFFKYTGQMWLPEIGLYHYRARAYDPRLGRFLQTDPIGYKESPNLYAYVQNDPLNWTDPTGTSMLAKWMWSCYGNCKANSGYWNTGNEGLSTSTQPQATSGGSAGAGRGTDGQPPRRRPYP